MADERVDILLGLKTQLEGHTAALSFLTSFATGLAGVGLAFGAAELGSKLGELVKGSADLGNQLTIMAGRAQMTTTAFQALWLTSAEFGVKQEDLVRGADTLAKNLEIAAKGAGSGAVGAKLFNQSLTDLDLTAAGLQALAPERQFEVIGERIANATDKHAAFNAAMELLGAKTAPKLLEYLKRLGVEGYDKLAGSVKNIALSEAQIAALEKAANAWERLWTSVKLIGAHATLLMAPEQKNNPALPSGQIAILQSRLAAYEAHGRGDEPQAIEYRRTLAVLQEREAKAAVETAAVREKSAAASAQAMAAADRTAQLQGLDAQGKKLTFEIEKHAALGKALGEVAKKMREQDAAQEREAERLRALADPMAKYRRDLETIAGLEALGKMTKEEASSATAKLTFELAGGFTPAIEDAKNKLLKFEEAANRLAENPFLADQEKHRQRVALLKQENAEIERRVAALRSEVALHPGGDTKSATHEIDTLEKKIVANDKAAGVFDPASAGFGANLLHDIQALRSKIETPLQGLAGTISKTIGGGFDAATQHLTSFLTGAERGNQVLAGIGRTIETDIIGGILHMGVQWVEEQVLMATFGKSIQAANAAATAATALVLAGTLSAAMIGPATLATIASWGGAAAAAPGELAAALAASAPLALFSQGGFTGDDLGIVHPREFVFSEPAVNRLGLDNLDALHTAARSGGAPAAAGGGSFGGKQSRVIVEHSFSPAATRQFLEDPNFESAVHRIVVRRFAV